MGNYKKVSSFTDVLNFLTYYRYRNCYNWFWNIQFDFESIIKHLDEDILKELYYEHTIQYNDKYRLKYIPKKFFAIMGKDSNNYYFYDMYNFLDTSLNKAAKDMLHDEKRTDIVDSSQLNTNEQYWIDHEEDIITYCIKDAELTKRLADKFWNMIYDNMKFYPKSPMSKGKLSEEYFMHTCDIPTINRINEKAVEIAYNTYYGGHFEILKRGFFENVYSYDIKSAYPAHIAQLIDFSKGKWEKVTKLNPDCHSGFYKCRIETLQPNFSPFMKKIGLQEKGLNTYPNGRFTQYLTKEEIEFCTLHFPNSVIKIVFGWEFTPKTLVYPFKSEIERLYAWKESEKNPDIKLCVKIILNSLYGKFIQVSGETHQTGKIFNPIYAAKITAGARLKILELALQKPEDIISFSTDSVISTVPLKTPKNPVMGDFQLDFEGCGVFIMSDIYNLWNDEKKKIKSKLRGFSLASVKDIEKDQIYLKDILDIMGNTTEYVYFTERPDHLGECIMHTKTKSIKKNLNVFSEHEKTIDVNGDNKRVWEKDFKNGRACLKENHSSLPLLVS